MRCEVCSWDQKGEEASPTIKLGRAFQAEGTAHAKAQARKSLVLEQKAVKEWGVRRGQEMGRAWMAQGFTGLVKGLGFVL